MNRRPPTTSVLPASLADQRTRHHLLMAACDTIPLETMTDAETRCAIFDALTLTVTI